MLVLGMVVAEGGGVVVAAAVEGEDVVLVGSN